MSVLLMRLAGPMQSWGVQSRWDDRDTGLEPSKSGVVGVVACALGRPREARLDDLAALRMGVRVDREGHHETDYQTVQDVARVKGKEADSRNAVVTNRHFLSDADFVVGLEGEEAFLREIDAALRHPFWPIFLGRRAFAPSIPVAFPLRGPLAPPIRDGVLEEVLPAIPMAGDGDPSGLLRLVVEVPTGKADAIRLDQPVGASFASRGFVPRGVKLISLPVAAVPRLEAP